MKKIVWVLLPLLLIGTVAFTDDNQSAAWVRTLTREAVTDSIDAAYFNPAGTAFLDKGLYIQAMNLSVLQEYSHVSAVPPNNTYAADTPIWFFPTARIGYNGGSWAVFFDLSIPAGGGSLDYDEGAVYVDVAQALVDAGITAGAFKGQSSTLAFSLGGAYRINDMISVGASGRLLYGTETFEATLVSPTAIGVGGLGGTVEAEASGIGFGGMVGVDFIPFSGLTIAVTLETMAKLELEYTSVSSANPNLISLIANPLFLGITEGSTEDADLPWRIRTGFAYAMPFGLTVSGTFKYDLYKVTDDSLRNSWSAAGSLAYDFTDRIQASIAGSYDIDEVPDVDDYDPLNPELSSFTLAGGVGIKVIKGLQVDAGVLKVFYQEATATPPGLPNRPFVTDMNKKVLLLAVGVTYKF